MRVIWRSLTSSVSPHTDVAGGQGRSRLLQHMLHDLALFHVTENDAVYFFFNILDLSIMTGEKLTVFVFVFQLAQRIHITLEHTKVCLLGAHDGDNRCHELVSYEHELFLWFIQTALTERMPL